jgi:hypothetical protein
MHMCYGRHTGYGGYGEWARGGRQISLDERSLGEDMRTWIRMENGSILGDVHLNATYGRDHYAMSGQGAMSGQAAMSGHGMTFSSQNLGFIYLWMVIVVGLSSTF